MSETLFDFIRPNQADNRDAGKLHTRRTHDDYSTPQHYADRIRAALGGFIMCDPASSDADNQIIRANIYYTHENSGLASNNLWISPVYLNPPSVAREEFLRRAAFEARAGCEMIVCLNTKHLCTTYTVDTVIPLVAAMHIPRGRPAFLHGETKSRTESPTDGRVFLYIGPEPERFTKVFAQDTGWTCLVQPITLHRKPGQARV